MTGAGNVWYVMNERLAEIAEYKNGLETPLQWDKAIKSITLCMLIGIMTLVSAECLGTSAKEIISFFPYYDDDERQEGSDKKTGTRDPEGTAALFDFLYQIIPGIYAWLVFTLIVLGSHVFHIVFWTLDDNFSCDLVSVDYAAVDTIMTGWTSKQKCLETIDNAFKIVDADNDGYISRCEDASYQVFKGATKEYAFKYSTSWTLAEAKQLCNDM